MKTKRESPLFRTLHVLLSSLLLACCPMLACAATTQPTTAPTTAPVQTVKTYYVVGGSGNDSWDGSAAHPWKSIHVVDNATVLVTGTFHQTVSFGDHVNAKVDGQNKTTIDSDYCTQWKGSKGCTLANAVLTSDDGNGLGGNVYGDGVTLDNVNLGNLSEGFDYLGPVTNLTITGGGQVGKVAGRCHYFLNVVGLKWNGDPTKHFGPASTQSPIRMSPSVGVKNGVINDVHVTQAGSSFPIACWAIHYAGNVTWNNCSADGGEFSFSAAGGSETDIVTGCVVNGLTTNNTKVSLTQNVATNNKFVGGAYVNPGGECVAVGCSAKSGNTFSGMTLKSPKHGFHFYTTNDTIIKNVTLIAPVGTPIIDGASTKSNDGGGNTVKQK